MHCRGKFQFVPVSGSTNTAPPPPRITVTTQNTTPPPFWGPLPLRRPISISGVSQQRTSRHRHRLQQTEESAPAPTAVVAAPLALLFTGRRAASCVSPPRPRPTSPSSSRCGAAAWVHLSQTDRRTDGTGVLLEWGKEKIGLCRRRGERKGGDACTCHRHRIWLLLYRLSITLDGECVRERASAG